MNAFSLCQGGLGSFIIDVKGVAPARAQCYRGISEEGLQSLQRRGQQAEEIFWADKPSDHGFTAIAVDTDIKRTQNRAFAELIYSAFRYYRHFRCAPEVSFYLLPFSLRSLFMGLPANRWGTLLVVRRGVKTDVRRRNSLTLYNNIEYRLEEEMGCLTLRGPCDRKYNPIAFLQG